MDNIWLTGGHVENVKERLGFEINNGNLTKENREKTASYLAAISRDTRGVKNPKRLFENILLQEAAPDYPLDCIPDAIEMDLDLRQQAGRAVEYIPVAFTFNEGIDHVELYDKDDKKYTISKALWYDFLRHAYIYQNMVYTNFRNVYNVLGQEFRNDQILNSMFTHTNNSSNDIYIAYEVSAPYFVFAQIRTHGRMTQVAVSERKVKENKYWLPDDIVDRIVRKKDELPEKFKDLVDKVTRGYTVGYELVFRNIKLVEDIEAEALFWKRVSNNTFNMFSSEDKKEVINKIIHEFLYHMVVPDVKEFLKELGYHQEIYERWPSHMKYKTWIIGGWINDPLAWGHLLLERHGYKELVKSWTQKQTEELIIALRDAIHRDYGQNIGIQG